MRQLHLGPMLTLRTLQVSDAKRVAALVELNGAYLRQWLPWLDGSQAVEDTFANSNVCLLTPPRARTFRGPAGEALPGRPL